MKRLLRREAVVLFATAAILALLYARLARGAETLRGTPRVTSPELVHHRAPDPLRVLPSRSTTEEGPADTGGESANGSTPRNLFAEPSDTRPLPPLAFESPPRRELPGLAPPTVPGPAPELYGRYLRRVVEPLEESELFAARESDSGASETPETRGADVRRALEELDRSRKTEGERELPSERAARIESNKHLYDWIQLTSLTTLFGSIQNEERYGLFSGGREEEPILFLQVDPATGREAFTGQPALAYERERIVDFGLARNRANEIELFYRGTEGRIAPGRYHELLSFAASCIDDRHEAPRALEIAETLYRRLSEFDPQDPAPRIGLGRVFEARFDFESAFAEYGALLERFAHKADVYVALARLEERCLLFESAEARLRTAVAVERTSWRAQWALGRTLLARGREGAALEHLAIANRNAPEDPEALATRVSMRVDLARAHVRAGDLRAAVEQIELALALDPQRQEAIAALVSSAVLDQGVVSVTPGASSEEELERWLAPLEERRDGDARASGTGLRFDLLLALGLFDLSRDRLAPARERLLAAAEADPLRASLAWRALSHLAELAGANEEAWRFVELARECDPLDPWTLFQRGRLLAKSDDLEGAREAFGAALERDLDFDEAVLALGEIAARLGRHEDAERYLERAAERLPDRPEVFALRGANALERGRWYDAREAFERALALDAGDPIALGGAAWCAYRTGDPEEALVQLAELEDSRREHAADDPYRAWARGTIERLEDHLAKVEWQDAFERSALRNGWQVEEGAGPLVEIAEGKVTLEGAFTRAGRTRLFREYPGHQLVSFEARMWIGGEGAVRAGVFVGRERLRQRTFETTSAASVARDKNGALEVELQRSATGDGEVLTAETAAFPTDRWVTVRIERGGDDAAPTVDVFLDELPLVLGAPLSELWRASQAVRVGAFVEGDTGRRALLSLDLVRVVYREERE